MEFVQLLIQLLLSLAFLNIAYYSGKLFWIIRYGIHHEHYFIGIGPELFNFKIWGRKLSVGIYFPVIGFARIFNYKSGIKYRACNSWEFQEHKLYKRFLATVGGAISLYVSSVILFIMITYIETEPYLSKEEVNKYGINPSELAREAGFQNGDKITLIIDKDFDSFNEILYPLEGFRYKIIRNEKEFELIIDKPTASKNSAMYEPFFSVYAPFKIKSFTPHSEAERIGLIPGDQISKVNNIPVTTLQEFKKTWLSDEDGFVDLSIIRKNQFEEVILNGVKRDNNGNLGIFPEDMLQYSIKQNSVSEAVVKGISKSHNVLFSNIRGTLKFFSGEVNTDNQKMTGPVGIAKIYSNNIDWLRFWTITGVLGLFGSFASLMPLPNSNFWNLIPLFYEAVTKKKFSILWHKKIKRSGFIIVVLIMVYIIFADIMENFY